MPTRCIYCNSEDLTVSDIIPWALTGAKLRKKSVCKKHNGFTNDHYEKHMIDTLAFFRNQIGLTERDGDPVRYTVDVEIDGENLENVQLTDRTSFFGNTNRLFHIKKDGKQSLVGNIDLLSKKKGVKREDLKALDAQNTTINKKFSLNEMFISNEALHTIAKITYEWHCLVNGITGYEKEQYEGIVSYILNPDADNDFVEIVIDGFAYTTMDSFCRPGSNMIYEYIDANGFQYVIFGLWDIIMYKVKIRDTGRQIILPSTLIKAYLYHSDGSNGETVFGILGIPQILSEIPLNALTRIQRDIANRLQQLIQRYLSLNYLKSCADALKVAIQKYTIGKNDFSALFDYGNQDRVIPIYIFRKLLDNQYHYKAAKTFNDNLRELLGVEDAFILTKECQDAALRDYSEMETKGTLISMMETSINYFETIYGLY